MRLKLDRTLKQSVTEPISGSENACRRLGLVNKVNISLLKPTGHVMHHQFNNQQLYALPTVYLCVLYLSENKQRLVPLTA
jgi:hypothetical protein